MPGLILSFVGREEACYSWPPACAEGAASAAQWRVDSDLREIPTSGFAVTNLKWGLHVKRLTLVVGLDNVFDRYYVEHYSYQRDPFRNGVRVAEPGRNLFVNTAYGF